MQIKLSKGTPLTADADVVIVPAFDSQADQHPVDAATQGAVRELYESGEFSGKAQETVLIHRPQGLAAKRLLLVGAGDRNKLSTSDLRKAAGTALRAVKSKSLKRLAIALPDDLQQGVWVRAAVEGAILGDFEPDHLKTDPKKAEKRVESLEIIAGDVAGLKSAVEQAQWIGNAQNLTRELVNIPANLLTPLKLADRAQQMAAEAGLECEILDRERMQQLGMGALLGVAQGSAEPPALIVLRYRPDQGAGKDHLALIGKGVTFDTGGVSIKPSEGMEKMKYDMAGGAAVIGAMQALAKLKPGIAVTGFIPTVENMVGSRAQRPGDIVTSLNGKTVEVLNTDAEGRLILIDAMTYAIRQGCTHLIDAATLTGAIAVALGHIYAGAFTNNQDFLTRVLSASKTEGERMWQLPLDDDYKDYLKSAFADLPNIGGRYGGAITAAYFLKEFTEDKPWVHLDIAGTAWLDENKPWMAKGPTGLPMRSFVRLALDWETPGN